MLAKVERTESVITVRRVDVSVTEGDAGESDRGSFILL